MKKQVSVSTGKRTAHPISKICAVLLVGIGLSMGGVSIYADSSPKPSPTPKPAKPSPTPKPPKPSPTPKPPKPSPTPKPGQCVVCDHDGGKAHDHPIDCKDIDK